MTKVPYHFKRGDVVTWVTHFRGNGANDLLERAKKRNGDGPFVVTHVEDACPESRSAHPQVLSLSKDGKPIVRRNKERHKITGALFQPVR